MPNINNMNTFNTKYNLKWSHVDDLQGNQQSDQPTSTDAGSTSSANTSSVKPVGANYIPVYKKQLSGKGSNNNLNTITNLPGEHEVSAPSHEAVWTEKRGRRLFKKDGIIYDLLN